ncbi:MAG TPA: NUDIX domain-containing protein [Candidatus Paceibacterota bacterium]|nr:NUDIX domain-containing protein [Candidatus Paceibacterota bacterium]
MPHVHDKIDFTAEVFVVFKDKVLLRKHDKYKIWLSVGGHIELDEDPNQAAVREVKEEVGLDIRLVDKNFESRESDSYKELMTPKFLHRHRVGEDHEHVTMVYFGVAKNGDIEQEDGELSDEIKWFTKDELDEKDYGIRESIRYHAKKALEELKGVEY